MPNNAPLRSFDVRVDTFDSKVLLVRGMDAYQVDEVGEAIWQLCDGTHSVAQIAERIASLFAVDVVTAEADAARFITQMRRAHLLE